MSRRAVITLGMGNGPHLSAERRLVVHGPRDVIDLIGRGLGDARDEMVLVGYLAADGTLIALVRVALGDDVGCEMPVATILRGAVQREAHAIIVAHNHPSGDAAPSDADLAATRRLATGSALLGLELLDHLVVAKTGWSSMRVAGLL